jgi:hypothetical protein
LSTAADKAYGLLGAMSMRNMTDDPASFAEFKIGDLMTLRHATHDGSGFLIGDGVVDNEVVVTTSPISDVSAIHDCIFEICVPTRNSAAKDLENFKRKHSLVAAHKLKSKDATHLATLRNLQQKELEMNQKLMHEKLGEIVMYGEVVQLKHVKSKKFLTASDMETSLSEPENFKVFLSETASWLTLQPAKAFNTLNEPVINHSELQFVIYAGEAEYLHVSAKSFSDPNPLKRDAAAKVYEVNTSLSTGTWKMDLFCPCNETSQYNETKVCIGDVIYFRDPELEAYIQAEPTTNAVELKKFEKVEYGRTNLRGDEEEFDSAAYFVVEKEAAVASEGGGTVWCKDRIVLRNVNSGTTLRLAGDTEFTCDVKRGVETSIAFEGLKSHKRVELTVNQAMRLVMTASGQSTLCFQSVQETDTDTRKHSLRINAVQDMGAFSPILLHKATLAVCHDLFFGLRLRSQLRNLVARLRARNLAGLESCSPILKLFTAAKNFVCTSEEDAYGGLRSYHAETNPSRQKVMREQGVLDLLVGIIEELSHITEEAKLEIHALTLLNTSASNGRRMSNTNVRSDPETQFIKALSNHCFNTLHANLIRCPHNKMAVERHLDTLLTRVGSQASWNCITELLDSKEVVQQLTTDQVDIFIKMLDKHQLKFTVLDMLRTLCRLGQGEDAEMLPQNQAKLCERLLELHAKTPKLAEITTTIGGEIAFRFPNTEEVIRPADMKHRNAQGILKEGNDPATILRKNFLCAQVHLFAEMCSGRNYSVIDKINSLINFDTTVQCIQDDDLHPEIRSAFLRLCLCVYVDRLPQVQRHWNNATFINNENGEIVPVSSMFISAAAEQEMEQRNNYQPNTSSSSKKKMGRSLSMQIMDRPINDEEVKQLRMTIAAHMCKNDWSSVTARMTELMSQLIDFSLYDTHEHELGDIVGVVLERLEREWTDLDSEEGRDAMFTSPLQVMIARRATERSKRTRRRSSQGMNAVMPLMSGAKNEHVDVDDELSQSLLESIMPWRWASLRRGSYSCVDMLYSENLRKRMLRVLDDWRVMIFILFIVFAAVVAAFVVPQAQQETIPFKVWDIISFTIFLVELTCRMWALGVHVRGTKMLFFTNPYCVIDFIIVLLDIVSLAAESLPDSIGDNVIILRIVRLIRLARLLKVMRIMKKLRDEMLKKKEVPPWVLPKKFKHAPKEMLDSMTGMVTVTRKMADLFEDQQLQALLSELVSKLSGVHSPEEMAELSAEEILHRAETVESPLKLDLHNVQNLTTVMHLIMYDHAKLAQESIELLMTVFTARNNLVKDVLRAQVLFEDDEVQQYRDIAKYMTRIAHEMEKFQLWGDQEDEAEQAEKEEEEEEVVVLADGEDALNKAVVKRGPLIEAVVPGKDDKRGPLIEAVVPGKDEELRGPVAVVQLKDESKEKKRGTPMMKKRRTTFVRLRGANQRMLGIKQAFTHLTDHCRQPNSDYILGSQEPFMPVSDVQNILQDLELDSEYLSWRKTIDYPEDGDDSVFARRVRNLCRWMNTLMEAFVLRNEQNQGKVFRLLPLLTDDMKTGVVGSAELIAATVRHNQQLIKLLPNNFIADVVETIRTRGSAALLKVLDSVVQIGRVPNRPAQIKVTNFLADEACPQEQGLSTLDKAEKKTAFECFREICEEFATKRPAHQIFAIYPKAYMLRAMDLACNCASGATNIVEAKIQTAVVPNQMLQMAMQQLVPPAVQYRYVKLLFDAVLEVQVAVPIINYNPRMWYYVSEFPRIIRKGCRCLDNVDSLLFNDEASRYEVLHAFEVVLPSIVHFFTVYYTPEDHTFKPFQIEHLAAKLGAEVEPTNPLLEQLLAPGYKPPPYCESSDSLMRALLQATDVAMNAASGIKMPFAEIAKEAKAIMQPFVDIAERRRVDGVVPNLELDMAHHDHTLQRVKTTQVSTSRRWTIDNARKKSPRSFNSQSMPSTAVVDRLPSTGELREEEEEEEEQQGAGGDGGGAARMTRSSMQMRMHGRNEELRDRTYALFVGQNDQLTQVDKKKVSRSDRNVKKRRLAVLLAKMKDRTPGSDELTKLADYLNSVPHLSHYVDEVGFERTGILRYEPLVSKLVAHTRSRLQVYGERKILPAQYQTSAVWTMNLLRTMVEQAWGFTIFERDDLGDEESDKRVEYIQDALSDAHAPEMCIEFIAKGVEGPVVMEALKLLMAMLYREGGNNKVQRTVHTFLQSSKTGMDFFFFQACNMCSNTLQWHEAEVEEQLESVFIENEASIAGEVSAFPDAEQQASTKQSMPPEALLLIALQLLCEGHFTPNQDMMRQQSVTDNSVNMLDSTLDVLKQLGKQQTASARNTCQLVSDLILELIQGPCVGNQVHFALHTDLLETLNALMCTLQPLPVKDGSSEEEEELIVEELKRTFLKIFKALLEGKGNKQSPMIYRRVLSVLHLEVLQTLVNPPELEYNDNEDAADLEKRLEAQEKKEQEPMSPVQVEAVLLIEMLRGYQPEITNELRLHESVRAKVKANVISLEVVWHHKLQRRFFHVPELCKHLSKTTREWVVSTVNRENQELKLGHFTQMAHVVHAELKHQEWLELLSVDRLFSRTIQNNATWITFIINMIINGIYLFNLKLDKSSLANADTDRGWNIDIAGMNDRGVKFAYKNPDFANVIKALNVAQISLSLFTLVLFAVVRAPVTYIEALRENGSRFQSFIAIWTQSLTGYYVFYLTMAIIGGLSSYGTLQEFYGPLCNSLLLMDVLVKSPVSRDVIQAVIIPYKALGATVILAIFTIYIFSFIYFYGYHDHFSYGECDDFLRCFQVSVGYGLRAGGGIGEVLFNSKQKDNDSLGDRFVFDLIFFVLVLIILLNVIFGIIIDTFSELREEKKERSRNTTQMCFVCGVHKGVYDLLGSGVFKRHIEHEHNMWAYLKFMVFLWEQDRDDDDGLEQFVRNCIEEEDSDITWYPSHKSLLLESKQEEDSKQLSEESLITDLFSKMERDNELRHKLLAEQIEKIRTDVDGLKSTDGDDLTRFERAISMG